MFCGFNPQAHTDRNSTPLNDLLIDKLNSFIKKL